MLTHSEIRQKFLNYFEKNDHKIIKSSPLIPQNDPSILFVNSGMVPFKNYFTGTEKPEFKRIVTCQKCVRAGGKHNDLKNVGYNTRHHTFFEMLGNFSFGDYFKEKAIFYAWEFLTKELFIPPSKLLVTIYHNDEESYKFWKKISGLDDKRIIRINTNDNFWSMGNEGPCGPCSEIFYDHGDGNDRNLPGSKNEDANRYVEIWNLVFMQFERMKNGEMRDLPNPSIDTGMGLERITAIIQNVHDNYEIDIFNAILKNIKSL